MAITRFQDLPSTSTPINSTNLNGNFDELGAKVGTSIDSNYRVNILFSNLLNGIQWEQGTIRGTTGELVDSTTRIRTKAVKVAPSTTYTINMNTTYGYGVIGYSSASASDFTESIITAFETGKNTFTTGANTTYIRIVVGTGTNWTSAITPSVVSNMSAIISLGSSIITPTINVDGEDIYVKGQNEIYSTTEQRIGTYLGKPLYRKVFEIPQTSINSSDVTVINFNLADTNYVTKIEGMIGVTTSNTYYPIFGSPNRANVGYQVRRVSGAIQIIVDQTMSAESSIKGGQMIVEYTKTTD